MGRKSNKQLIQEQLDACLTVDKLREYLALFSGDTLIGRGGHFGEFVPTSKIIPVHKSRGFVTPDGNWRSSNRTEVTFLEIDCPDIGPEPD